MGDRYAGRHLNRRTGRGRGLPTTAAALTIGSLFVGVTLYQLTANEGTEQLASTADPTSTAEPTASPQSERQADRASRGEERLAGPTAKPTPTGADESEVLSTGTCKASFYDEPQGTANGETFDPEALTAAHKSLPFNSRVRVTNVANGRSVEVRINDRGPYIAGRCIDLSRAAFREIANLGAGVVSVRYEVLAKDAT